MVSSEKLPDDMVVRSLAVGPRGQTHAHRLGHGIQETSITHSDLPVFEMDFQDTSQIRQMPDHVAASMDATLCQHRYILSHTDVFITEVV